jgi:hypothetical protein
LLRPADESDEMLGVGAGDLLLNRFQRFLQADFRAEEKAKGLL